jgi:hypothetical protein
VVFYRHYLMGAFSLKFLQMLCLMSKSKWRIYVIMLHWCWTYKHDFVHFQRDHQCDSIWSHLQTLAPFLFWQFEPCWVGWRPQLLQKSFGERPGRSTLVLYKWPKVSNFFKLIFVIITLNSKISKLIKWFKQFILSKDFKVLGKFKMLK